MRLKKSSSEYYVAGKTGTPERIFKGEAINDGWYVFFAPKAQRNRAYGCLLYELKEQKDPVMQSG